MISRGGAYKYIPRSDRLTVVRWFADELATIPDLNLIPVVVDKRGKASPYDVFEMAWKVLVQRFENALSNHNFRGPGNPDERGMLFPDRTDDKKLVLLLRRMRRYNPVPNQFGSGYRNLAVANVIEDPSFRDSTHSHFIQAADLAAFLLYQRQAPNAYMRRKSGNNYFCRLDSLVCKVASPKDPEGIVRL